MGTSRTNEPVAISAIDLPDSGQFLVQDCNECDCACAVASQESILRGNLILGELPPGEQLVRGTAIFECALDEEHFVLFHTAGSGQAVVVNQPAYQIFRAFDWPTTVPAGRVAAAREMVGDIDGVLARLYSASVIQRVQERAGPPFAEPNSSQSSLTAWLHVSNACNLACPYCYVNKSASAMDEPTGIAAVDTVLRSAAAHGFAAVKLKYAGGEASLNRDLVLRLDGYARSRAAGLGLRFDAVLLSNGLRLSSAFVDVLKASGVKIMISLDGVGAAHDAQRPTVAGKPSFISVERTIRRLCAVGHPPHLSVTITARNAAGIADVVRFALEAGLTFSLNFFRDNECAASFADLRYSEAAMIDGMRAAFKVIEENLPPWSVLGSVLDRGQLLQPRQRPCGVGQDYVVIDHEGKVAKCHMEIERTLGDVFRDDPVQLVRNDTRTTLNLLVDEKEGCRDCSWKYWCSGGCPVATFRASGRYDVKSPNCGIYQAIYPEALRLEGLRLLKYATHLGVMGAEAPQN